MVRFCHLRRGEHGETVPLERDDAGGCRALPRNAMHDTGMPSQASHISNADLCEENNGYESAGVRPGYHF